MADLEMLKKINSRLREMHDEATRMKENPRVIQLIAILAELTGGAPEVQAADQPVASAAAAADAEEHVHGWDAFGRCKCGACLHLKTVGNVCLACDKEVKAAA
jgi:hypothetical protein